MSITPVRIYNRPEKMLVDANLHLELTPQDLIDAEGEWGPVRREAARRICKLGDPEAVPGHWHWDWKRKSQSLQLLAYRCCGIECDGKMQGLLMMLLLQELSMRKTASCRFVQTHFERRSQA